MKLTTATFPREVGLGHGAAGRIDQLKGRQRVADGQMRDGVRQRSLPGAPDAAGDRAVAADFEIELHARAGPQAREFARVGHPEGHHHGAHVVGDRAMGDEHGAGSRVERHHHPIHGVRPGSKGSSENHRKENAHSVELYENQSDL